MFMSCISVFQCDDMPYNRAAQIGVLKHFDESEDTMQKYICDVCGYIYNPAVGDPDSGIEPGTAFEDIPDDWVCPVCMVGKDNFSLYEE